MNRCIAKSQSARGNRCALNARYTVVKTVDGWAASGEYTMEQWCLRHAQAVARQRNALAQE